MQKSETRVRQAVLSHLQNGGYLTLFLDYDGTLVPIAPAPAQALPDDELLHLLTSLSQTPAIRTVILSGRSLENLQQMLPVGGLLLGGLYGVEMQIQGKTIMREPSAGVSRRALTKIRESWNALSAGLPGFLLEDKGQALALHARWADPRQAAHVLRAARDAATDILDPRSFRILDGNQFLEIAPASADKGQTVDWLLTEYPVGRDLPVGFGDDNKDEAAFAAIQRHDGFAVGVGYRYPLPGVDARLDSPEAVRVWLRSFT